MNRQERRRQQRLTRQANVQGLERASAHFNLGCTLQGQGRLEEAAAAYREALAIFPGDVDARNNLGNVLRDLGQSEEARAAYQQVLEANPGYALAHFNLGNLLRVERKYDEAIACYRRALDIRPDYADACNNLGVTLLAKGALEDAAAAFLRATACDPGNVMAHFNYANCLRDKGKLGEAVAAYRAALALDPNYFAALANLGDALRRLGRAKEAEESLRKAMEINPKHVATRFHLADALKDQRRFLEAVEVYRSVLAENPKDTNALNNLGNLYKDLDRMEESLACYEQALAIDPNHPDARLNHAREHVFFPGDPALDKLKALAERTDWDSDKRNQVVFALGKAHDEIGLYAEAFAYFERGNADWAKHVTYDREQHRRSTERIIQVFSELDPVAEPEPAPGPVPVFVVGLSRAGKTLVESVLEQGREVFPARERPEFVNLMDEARLSHKLDVSYPESVARLSLAQLRALGARYLELIAAIERLATSGPPARFLVNTLPGNYRYLGAIFRALPGARVIYCRRAALDQCLQIFFKRYSSGNAHTYTFENLASYYRDYRNLMAHWQALYPEGVLEVRYEELVRDPAGQARRIFAHCGIDYDPAGLRADFQAGEIGHWRHYEAFIGPLRQALGPLADD